MNSMIEVIPGVHPAAFIMEKKPAEAKLPAYRLASRLFHGDSTTIEVGNVTIGEPEFTVIAGPCSIENETQLLSTAHAVKGAGAAILRGGAFKPRSSPYSFQGLEEPGLKLLQRAGKINGMPVVTEVMDSCDIPLVEAYADILQVGTRNIQNYSLLKKLGSCGKPVLLKRGLMTTLDEFLMSAEYILAGGNNKVILCERGIRTFETATRNTLDLSAIPILKERTHLPIIVDPSHALGDAKYVIPMAKAALAVGADGIMVEVHIEPEKALCDGAQSLRPEMFHQLMVELKAIAALLGRIL